MIKKFLVAILSGVMITSLVSCSASNNKKVDESNMAAKSSITENEEASFIGEGEWATDYTREEVTALNEEITARMEEVCNFLGLEYIKEEKIKEENSESVNDKYIYFDNLNPEPNKIESMYYGFKTYGSNMAKGNLNLKIGLKLDLDQIKNEEKFDLKETSISNFSEAMTNDIERDYTEINEKIIDIVKNQNSDGTIETNLNGLVETITIKDEFLLYRLDSKMYDFKK